MNLKRWTAASTTALLLTLAACAGALDEQSAHAAPANAWPPVWQDAPEPAPGDFTPPVFERPNATHCHRPPGTREVPGGGGEQASRAWRSRRGEPEDSERESRSEARPMAKSAPVGSALADASRAAPASPATLSPPAVAADERAIAPSPWPQPQRVPQRPAQETVTAGMQDDNADFGEYLAYRQRHTHLPVRERDISERYLLEVTDTAGRPVHDAEVAVQRPGIAQPVMWARTDTAGRVWLHPRAFIASGANDERVLGVAVRKGAMQARATLLRGQAQAVQVQLGAQAQAQRPRLDLVFLIDATGSMGDEIAKLKGSMRAVAQQISQLPGQPDICYGLVAYRDRGDAFLTRTHDFTDDLGAFQNVLARVQAGGGGDTPEALNEALHETVHGLAWRSDAARLVADAPPHLDYGGPQYDRDMQAALSKGIKLFAVGASGLDPVGEYIYRQMAQYTAGRFVFLTYRDAANPGSGPGTQTPHDVGQYSVQTLDRLIVRLVSEEMARLVRS
jgi:von Willebrand factor type A domain